MLTKQNIQVASKVSAKETPIEDNANDTNEG